MLLMMMMWRRSIGGEGGGGGDMGPSLVGGRGTGRVVGGGFGWRIGGMDGRCRWAGGR